MREFEELFKNNKTAFDRLEPKEETWASIKGSLGKEVHAIQEIKQKNAFFWLSSAFFKIAATILLVLGLSATWFLNSKANHVMAFEDITMVSPEGEQIALDPSLNKYTLVQFWESGNVLCTTDNCYYYLPAYEKYKKQGFEIYAISLDKDKTAWLSGIEENDLPWIHVSDLKGMASPVCIECNISKVPTSFLLNQKGEVVANDLDAEALDQTLAMLLGDAQ